MAPSDVTPPNPETMTKVREDIDRLDQQLLQILASRRRLSIEAAKLKEGDHSDLRDLPREQRLLRDRMRQAQDLGLDSHIAQRIFEEIVDDSVRIQHAYVQGKLNGAAVDERPLRVGHHGTGGSYCSLAARKHFERLTRKTQHQGFPTYQAVIKAVETGEVDCAIVPLDNTLSGARNEVYDLLMRVQLSIVGEEKVTIDHCLVGHAGASEHEISRVLCSASAMAECSAFLGQLEGKCRVEYVPDSGIAVQLVRSEQSPNVAAIASPEAAAAAGLTILRGHVSNRSDNQTRYVVIAAKPNRVDERIAAKTSIVLSTSQEPGALANVLAVFKTRGIALTKLESRPVPSNPWEEMFYLDFAGNLESPEVSEVLQELTRHTRFLKVLGCYPSCDLPPVGMVNTCALDGCADETVAPSTAAAPAAAAPAVAKSSSKKKGYTLASREHKADDTIIDVRGVKIGGNNFTVISGPCSVESYEQIMECARHAKECGSQLLRGGCFKPRSSPYSFQGLGYKGLEMLLEAGRRYGLPIITEVMSGEDVQAVAELTDVIQIGARNMQNFSLLKLIGRTSKPVMLKRGMSSSIDEMLQAVEYILAEGNQQVILCERGIRTFETATRNTLDISAVPVLRERSHLPVFIDPSHAAGERDLVVPLSIASKAVGAHGIIVEFHPEPEKALSDGPQALRFPQFADMMKRLASTPLYR